MSCSIATSRRSTRIVPRILWIWTEHTFLEEAGVQAGHFMSRGLQNRHHHSAEVTLVASHQYAHMLSFQAVLSARRWKIDACLLQHESLCVLAATLHATKPGQAEKRLFVEPVMRHLRWVVLEQQTGLLLGDIGGQRMKNVGPHCIRLPFQDLVAEDEVVAELGGQKLRQQSMILMGVVALRAEYHTGVARLPEIAADGP